MTTGASPQGDGTPPLSNETKAAIEALEVELSLMWRRARVASHTLSRSVHPDLEPAAYGLLSVLLHQGGMRLTELARSIGVGKPSVSRQISFLEGVGLVQKEADPSDGRAQLIELTPKGLAKMREVHDGRQQAFHNLLAHWDTKDLSTLATLIGRLNEDGAR
ncbi:MarR family transcriptional regulator [Arthrobacter livingstonensis]|uniref:MarR family transcriptional regulator n=1 Tax=Arthrobacter livingstonensis TaxID=670078 RepID=A0A2V5L3G9_9MICC|nr:MarR family transcriptional regulator [Arthrobacter livingstonensis]PYI65668.1 MarR family transcriptional regulator [Arthrobacter livingstonensis]